MARPSPPGCVSRANPKPLRCLRLSLNRAQPNLNQRLTRPRPNRKHSRPQKLPRSTVMQPESPAPVPLNSQPVTTPQPPPLPESFIIYLARHATPDRSRSDVTYHALPGPDLNEQGLGEAAELADFLHEMGVVSIIASPFERTRQTALILKERLGASLDIDPDLSERQPIEPEALVIERMLRAFTIGAQRAAKLGPLAIITHGAPVLVLLKALGLSPTVLERCRIYDNRNPIPMAGAWRVERLEGLLPQRSGRLEIAISPPAHPPSPEDVA
ncbi:MAG: hypothetical protein EHM21_00350, partial [Chloroflexi bacterium]